MKVIEIGKNIMKARGQEKGVKAGESEEERKREIKWEMNIKR